MQNTSLVQQTHDCSQYLLLSHQHRGKNGNFSRRSIGQSLFMFSLPLTRITSTPLSSCFTPTGPHSTASHPKSVCGQHLSIVRDSCCCSSSFTKLFMGLPHSFQDIIFITYESNNILYMEVSFKTLWKGYVISQGGI